MGVLENLKTAAELGTLTDLVVHGLSNEDYHSPECPGYSSSFLKTLRARSPAHAKQPREASPQMILGSAAHAAILEPENFELQYVIMPEGLRRDARTKAFQEFQEQHKGKSIVSFDDGQMIRGMQQSIMNHSRASELLKSSHKELSLFWQEPETGLILKVRPDALTQDNVIVDLKTTTDASPWAFSKTINSLGYHLSAYMYRLGVETVMKRKVKDYLLLVVEKSAPYACILYRLDDASLEKAELEFKAALNTLKHCDESNEWPGYPSDVVPIGLPAYAFYD